jgi:hypothetical protein
MTSRPHLHVALFIVALLGAPALAAPRLKVSDNRHFLVKDDGTPFFYLGDTAWELFHRLNREEAERYLKNRAEKQFTVIQAVVLAELDGLNDPNPYGQKPLVDNDPTRPNEDYFKHVDFVVNKAEEVGLFVGMLPTWGDKWRNAPDKGGIFTPRNAGTYGEFLGRRYKDKPIIWVLGGDRPIDDDNHRAILKAMAEGLRRGDGGNHLITFHPPGGNGSSTWLHGEPWLDFNMRQNGHVPEFTGRYDQTRADYDRSKPVKPVIDGEPIYEDHPVSFKAKELGHSVAADVRRPLYWDLFTGACGHTYGHHSVWQMYAPGRKPINGPLMPWFEAIDQPGAAQMQHGRRLIESRPFLARVPDDSILVPAEVTTSVPGAGTRRYAATRDADGTYTMVYAPVGRPFEVRMDVIKGPKVKAWWFNPRTGKAETAGEFETTGRRKFTPPDEGEALDWVLVLDDASKGYPPPGQMR